MQEDTNKELEKIKGRLQIIERTRLICNTQKEKIASLEEKNSSLYNEINKLNAQVKILTDNSLNFTNQVEENSKEIEKTLNEKDNEIEKIKIELKTLQEEYEIVVNQNIQNKELLIQKDIELQDNEKSHKNDIEEILKINQEIQTLTDKLNATEVNHSDLIKEYETKLEEKNKEIEKYKLLNEKFSVNKENNNNNDNIDDIEGLKMKNEYLSELVKMKDEEINKLKETNQK